MENKQKTKAENIPWIVAVKLKKGGGVYHPNMDGYEASQMAVALVKQGWIILGFHLIRKQDAITIQGYWDNHKNRKFLEDRGFKKI